MKKMYLLFGLLAILSISFALTASPRARAAYDPTGPGCTAAGETTGPVCGAIDEDPVSGSNGIINTTANIIAWVGGFIAVFMIIFSGFRFVTAGGDSGKVASARNTIIYSSIGLIVIVIARIIVSFVIGNLK